MADPSIHLPTWKRYQWTKLRLYCWSHYWIQNALLSRKWFHPSMSNSHKGHTFALEAFRRSIMEEWTHHLLSTTQMKNILRHNIHNRHDEKKCGDDDSHETVWTRLAWNTPMASWRKDRLNEFVIIMPMERMSPFVWLIQLHEEKIMLWRENLHDSLWGIEDMITYSMSYDTLFEGISTHGFRWWDMEQHVLVLFVYSILMLEGW